MYGSYNFLHNPAKAFDEWKVCFVIPTQEESADRNINVEHLILCRADPSSR